jgi:thiol:disulfide interchange protein
MKLKNYILLNFFISLIIIQYTNNLEFKKNKDTIKIKISNYSLVRNITSLNKIQKEIFEDKEKNHIILFYADWCHHWYKINIKIN